MKYLHRFASIWSWIFNRSRAEARLDDELRSVIEMAALDKIRDGVPPDEAHRQARLEFGGLEPVKEQVRDRRHGHRLDEIGRDVRHAARMFARTPGFTAVVVITLALGIGANTAIFSLLDALMLRVLPVGNPHELVQVNLRARDTPAQGGESFSYAIVRALDDRRNIFAGVAGFTSSAFDLTADGTVTRVPGALVTGGFYETLGLAPAAGRLLIRSDDVPDAPLVAVISDEFWARRYDRRADAIGSTIDANGVSIVVVGVTPHGFSGANVGSTADITMAVAALPQVRPSMKGLLGPGNFWLRVLARPAPGLTPDVTAARLNSLWPAIAEVVIAPHWSAVRRKAMAEHLFHFESGATGWTYLRGTYRQPLYVLMAAVSVVLMIACANIASLLLARATARRHEIAVRLAIGAGRGRIVRQLLIESTILSLGGAAVGVGLAWMASRVLVNMIAGGPADVVFDLTPNWRVLGFATALALATGAVFGLAPLRQTTRDTSAALRQGKRWSTGRSRLLPALVSLQVALAIVLLAGAGLFVRTLNNLRTLDPGFRTDGVFVIRLERRSSPTAEELLDAVRGVPGVMLAGLTTHTPLDGSTWSEPLVPAGQPIPENDNTHVIAADSPFFEAMRIAVVAGRGFDDRDTRGRTTVAIVNEQFARNIFPNQNPIGQHLAGPLMGRTKDLEIVGVVKNTSAAGLRRAPPPVVYVPFAQFEGSLEPSLAIRTAGPTGTTAAAIRDALQPRLPSTPVQVHALSEQVSSTLVRERMMATLAGAFGLLALALASIGLYGLLAFSVAQRSREIGIRMALGSQPSRVVGMVLSGGLRLVLAGVALGLPVVWLASRWIESMLFGLTATDPLAAGSAIGALLLCAVAAAYLPARRAARVDPVMVLKQE